MKKLVFSLFVTVSLLFSADVIDMGDGKAIFEKISVVEFKSGKIEIRDDHLEDLGEFVAFLKKNSSYSVVLYGRSDNVGNPVNNKALSKKRAIVLRSYLVKKGIKKSRLQIVALGDQKPIASNSTPAGQEINRSVEMILNTK